MQYFPSPDKKGRIFVSVVASIFVIVITLLGVGWVSTSHSWLEVVVSIGIASGFMLLPLHNWTLFVNLYPDVWVVEDGFYVSLNIWWKRKIEWTSVVKVKQVRNKGTLILAPRISWFHRGYGEKGLHGVYLPSKSNAPELIDIIEHHTLSLSERMIKVLQ